MDGLVLRGEPYDIECRIKRPNDGEMLWLHSIAQYDAVSNTVFGVIHDITERKNNEEKLRVSQQLLEGVFNAIPVRVFWKDRESLFLGCNSIFAHDAGFDDPKHLIGKSDYDMVWREQAASYRNDDLQVMQSGRAKLHIEEVQTTPQGNTITLLTSKIPLRDGAGDIVGILGTYIDISERKNIEEDLRRSREQLERAEKVAGFGNWEINLKTGKITRSEGTQVLDGLRQEHINVETVVSLMLPEYRELLDNALDGLVHRAEPYDLEFRLRRATDGEIRWMHAIAQYDAEKQLVFGVLHDITERKKAEEKLRKYELISSHSRDIVLFVRPDGSIAEANEAAVKAYGYSREELMEMKITALRAVNEDEDVMQMLHESIENGALFERLHKRRDGSTFPVEISANGALVGSSLISVSILRDITERKIAQQELGFRANILQNVHDGVIVLDQAGKVTYCNAGAATMSGYAPQEIQGRPAGMLSPALNPDKVRSILTTISDDADYAGEWEIISKDDSIFWIQVRISLMKDAAGNQTGYIAMIKDITASKKIEDELRSKTAFLEAQLDASIDGVVVVDAEGKVVLENNRSYEIMGTTREEHDLSIHDSRMKFMTQIVKDSDKFNHEISGLMSHPDAVLRDEMEFLNGTVVERYSAPITGEGGKYYGRIWNIHDITRRKRSEEKIATSLREKEILLKEIHHRVKNNMQVISSLLALQSQFIKNQDDASLFQDSQDRIRSMALVYNKLYQSNNLATINMKEYVEELVTNLVNSYSIVRECIHLEMDIDEVALGIEHAIPCGLVINELTVNALKHAFPGGRFGEICVTMHKSDQNIEMRIRDDGVGMPADFRFETSQTLGMGLVHSLVEDQLGGTIVFDSDKSGTQIKVVFNLDQGVG